MVREDSENDHLTGLKMRRAFEQSAMDMIDRGTRKNVPVSMIVADIDHFKQVNDIWGHQSGDRAIVAFGKLIQRMVRADDVCGRIGGEEFCIMIWNCELDPAERLAERVREAFAAMPHDGINSDVRLTASFGVATCRPQEGFGKLFARADAALYRAKEAGRNQVLADRREEKREPMAENAAAALATDEAA
nr:GGDEF domain-containing protein [Altererythrobacter lutimaris]